MNKKSNRGYTPQVLGTRLRDRVQYSPPWKVTQWGVGLRPASKGSDEWGNKAVSLVLPLLGCIDIFYEKNFDRSTWFLSASVNRTAIYISPDYKREAYMQYNGDFEKLIKTNPTMSDAEVRVRATTVELIEY